MPVAAGACMGADVTKDALNTMFRAIVDLIKYDKNVDLAMGFCNVRMVGKTLSVCFRPDLVKEVKAAKFENKMIR